MKKIFVSMVLLGSMLFFVAPVFSQNHQHHEGNGNGGGGNTNHEPDYTKFKTDLGLTDDQVTSWKNLDTQYKDKFKTIQSNASLTEDQKKAEFKTLQTSKEADLKNILSADQYTKYTENRGQRKGGKH